VTFLVLAWVLQYFFDHDSASLRIVDLAFPSPKRGVAVGYITEKNDVKPTAVITSDGGSTWTQVPLKEIPVSIFFLNDSLGFLVTTKGIWQTEEAGHSWRKLNGLRNIYCVYFLDPKHGFAAAARKQIYETTDGGRNWTKLPAAAQPTSNPDFTHYTVIQFANPHAGMITGFTRPPRRSVNVLPDWIDPEKAQHEWPNLSIALETRDGGKTWKPATTSMFGRIHKVRLTAAGSGVALIEFADAFEWPSEVHRLDWQSGKSVRVFREKNRHITDVGLAPDGTAYVTGSAVFGKLRRNPVPGQLKILKSKDFTTWTDMPVDYRATASRTTLSIADSENIWVATDTGMILKLVKQ